MHARLVGVRVQYIKVNEADAEKTKNFLLNKSLLAKGFRVLHSARYVYFPVDIASAKNKNLIGKAGLKAVRFIGKDSAAETRGRQTSYMDILSAFLSASELKELAKGYDPLGNIAVIELSDSLRGKEKRIGEAIIEGNKRIKTVLAKAGPVSGVYRLRKLRYVAGVKSYTADYRENGCRFVFDARRVFFSPRLSFERGRIAKLVRKGEHVAVPFAGVGPFAIEIAKAQKSSEVLAIELNGYAYRYMLKNIAINKTPNVKAVLGDFMEEAKKYKGFADRVVMPMPKTSTDFIDAALLVCRSEAHIHMYAFCEEAGIDGLVLKVRRRIEGRGYRFRLMGKREVRPYSKSDIEVVLDIKVKKLQ